MENQGPDNNRKINLLNIQSPDKLLTLKKNKNFCTQFFEKNKITTISGDPEELGESRDLVYDVSRAGNFDADAFRTIIDLLMQLRATGKDQSILVQNNTVLREQILNQLKNEVLRVGHKLTNNQVKNLEVISSNSFDEKMLTEMLKSLLESSKKKSETNEGFLDNLNVVRKSRYITSQRIGRDYLTVLNKNRYNENIVDSVLKNVYRNHLVYRQEFDTQVPGKENDEEKKKKITPRKPLEKKEVGLRRDNENGISEEFLKNYEENILNKTIIPKIVKLQSKISEFNILTKVGSFVENIIEESVPKILTRETELINKIVDKSDINEIRENIIENQQQYINDKTYYDRNINRVNNEVRKIYNSKIISKNVIDVLKTTKIKSLNLEENVRKNVIKLASKKDILNRFKNVYEHDVQKESERNVTNREELVNRYNVRQITDEEIQSLKDITNLRRSGVVLNKKFSENVRENDIIMQDFRIQRNKIKQVHEKVKSVIGRENVNILNKKIIVPQTKTDEIIMLSDKNIDGKEVYSYKPVYRRENIFDENEIQKIISKNITHILSPRVVKNRELRITSDNIYRTSKKRFIEKYSENLQGARREYLINPLLDTARDSYYNHFENDYMVYKEKEKMFEIKHKEKDKKNPHEIKKSEKQQHSQSSDVSKEANFKALEKSILSKTLSKKEVEGLIRSYVKGIDTEAISNLVMDKVERKFRIDRRRQGIF